MRTSRRRSRWIPLLIALLLAGLVRPGSSSAGQSARRAPGRPPGELEGPMRRQAGQAPARFGATVSRVRVDVIVTDSDGGFISDLGAGDFEVYEDGARQQILDVQLVDLVAGEVRPLLGPDAAGAARRAGPRPGNPPPSGAAASTDPGAAAAAGATAEDAAATANAPTQNAAGNLGAVIFLIDAPSLDQTAKARFGDAWARLLEQTDVPQVPRAAYMLDNYGRVQELAPLGYDLETIRAAAGKVREAPAFGTSMRRRLFELAADLTDTVSAPETDVMRLAAAAKARGFEAEERSRSLGTYELLTSFADALWSRSGRTAVVWVSTGIKLMQGGPYAALVSFQPNPAEASGGEPAAEDDPLAGLGFDLNSPDAQITAAQEKLHRAANAANVSFYSVDPTLLTETRRIGTDAEVSNGDAALRLDNPFVEGSIDALRDAMRMAATETGGRSFIHATDIETALEEIEADTSRFYLISYAPPQSKGDGAYHQIRVEVLRPGVDVRARSGYIDYPVEDRARRSIEVALALPGIANDLPVAAEAFRSRSLGGGPDLLSAVAVDGRDLGVGVGPGGDDQVSIDVHTVVLDADGVVDEAHEQLAARSGADRTAGPDPGGAPGPALVGFLAYQHEWTLDPGAYKLNVAVLDNVSGKVGATSLDVEIAAPGDEWGVSDPLLVATDESGRPRPVVRGRILGGQEIGAYVEVYGGVRPILSGQVFMEAAEGGDPQQGARLFPMLLLPAGPGLHRGSVPLPTGMPPGHYRVQLVITDQPAAKDVVLRLPIEIVAPSGR